jgi:glycosyltransferase involved in cell wall biosynthesis
MDNAQLKSKFFYICNVFEEKVKKERHISTDSPAASGKVIRLCRAVRSAGGFVSIISLGRGRQSGTWKAFAPTIRRSGRVPIVYLHYLNVPILTHIITALSLCTVLWRVTDRNSVLIFYNSEPHYTLALVLNRIMGRRCILDLEDGYRSDDKSLRGVINGYLLRLYNILIDGGAMVASTSLKSQTPLEPKRVFYGVAPIVDVERHWSKDKLNVLFGGSLLRDTGAELFLEALGVITTDYPQVHGRIKFFITGTGDYTGKIEKASKGVAADFIVFFGNVDKGKYKQLLRESHVGLCLKLPSSPMGATTFPSKVVEIATNGLLLLSTRVSDVPLVFADSEAFFLDEVTPNALAESLVHILNNPEKSRQMACNGKRKIRELLAPTIVGNKLLRFWRGIDLTDGLKAETT